MNLKFISLCIFLLILFILSCLWVGKLILNDWLKENE